MTLVGTTTLPDITDKTFSISLNVPAGTTSLDAIGLSGGSIVDDDFFPAATAGTATAGTADAKTYTLTFPANADVSTTISSSATAPTNAPMTCATVFDESLGNPWAVVGGEYATTNGGQATFTYTAGANSSIGVGVSATGKAGTFSASGTDSWSASGSITYPTEWYSYGSHRFETQFTENEYETLCSGGKGGTTYNYFNKADGWLASNTTVSTSSIGAAYCVWESGDSSFTKDTSSAWTFSSGMSIAGIDFNASMQTGYSTSAAWLFTFNPNDGRHLCGNNGYPGNTPGLLEVQP